MSELIKLFKVDVSLGPGAGAKFIGMLFEYALNIVSLSFVAYMLAKAVRYGLGL